METSYKQIQDSTIRDLLDEFDCQPILFVGSGLSKRYFSCPNWHELLELIHNHLPDGKPEFAYLLQKHEGNLEDVGKSLSDYVFEWAWSDGRSQFPEELFHTKTEKEVFIKYLACKIIEKSTPEKLESEDAILLRELSALSKVRPHAIITTNYDLFLEKIFDGYEAISGQTILRYNANSFGEIFHIHGDISNPDSIVLTATDYKDWDDKKKYVSAKLLTYFAEHPVFIIGYSVSDPNVKSILKDIAEIIDTGDGLINNIIHIIWEPDITKRNRPEVSTFQHGEKEYRIRAIYTDDFRWVYDALKSKTSISSVNPKLIRALAARTLKLIRTDIPNGSVEVNYQTLEQIASDSDHLPNLLGITTTHNPNATHPFTITQLSQRLGVKHWTTLNKLLQKIKEEKGIDLRSSDNPYHCNLRTGDKSSTRKWSRLALELFEKMLRNEDYEIQI